MSKVQARRTISYNRALFERAKERAGELRVPLSALSQYALERVLADGALQAADVIAASVERGVHARAIRTPKAPRKIAAGDGFYWRGRHRGSQPPPRPIGYVSHARLAAEWVLENGGEIAEAADRFACSIGAVRQAILRARVAAAKRESAMEQP